MTLISASDNCVGRGKGKKDDLGAYSVLVYQKIYTMMAPKFWAEAFEFWTVSETSDPPAQDAAGWYTDFGKIFILLLFKAIEPHN